MTGQFWWLSILDNILSTAGFRRKFGRGMLDRSNSKMKVTGQNLGSQDRNVHFLTIASNEVMCCWFFVKFFCAWVVRPRVRLVWLLLEIYNITQNIGHRLSFYKKLSYRRGTTRRATLVNLCYVSQGMGVSKVLTSKSNLQGHSKALVLVPFDRQHTIS